ncbi:MAG: DNA polymerase III subunit beta [Bacteroidia bacterium]
MKTNAGNTMKFIISASLLYKHLRVLAGTHNPTTVLPILDCFLFNLDKGTLQITASDLETTVSVKIALDSKDSFSAAIHVKPLMDMLKELPRDQALTIRLKAGNTDVVEISTDNGKYTLPAFDEGDFPKTPARNEINSIELPAGFILNGLNKTMVALATDTVRPVMTGVYFDMDREKPCLVATDARRLVKYTGNEPLVNKILSFILAKRTLNILKGLLEKGEQVLIGCNKTNAFIEYKEYLIVSRLIEGKFPDYDTVVPKENPFELVPDRLSLLSAVRRVALFARHNNPTIALKFTGKFLYLRASDTEYERSADEHIECAYAGEKMEIGFNADLLSDMLSNAESDDMRISFTSPVRPVIFTPSPEEEKKLNATYLMLLMPLIISNQ